MPLHERDAKVVCKPWGRELWLVHESPHYAMKILEVQAGKRLSLQYHREKVETSYVLSGRGRLILEDLQSQTLQTLEIGPQDYYSVVPPQRHRLEAVTDLRLLEVSTPHLDDVVRIEDDHQRPDGHIASEHGGA
ncbi:MAG: ectoine synthase [Deltaproteobacteria bacterium]|nr:ectoine synthase [Deltaproteobacteria bacterium]